MLLNYIIDEIRKREKEKELSHELFIECPVPERWDDRTPHEEGEETSNERGVVIVDFSI